MAGVCIGDSITIGANSCISKTIMEQGCYVSQPVRFIPFDPDKAMDGLSSFVTTVNGIKIYKK